MGTPVSMGHVNYSLMYDMLTGIRITVSRCYSREPRTLKDSDYHAQHKIAFDRNGNEITPTSAYQFKFKDYAPLVFRAVRDHLPNSRFLAVCRPYVAATLEGSPCFDSHLFLDRGWLDLKANKSFHVSGQRQMFRSEKGKLGYEFIHNINKSNLVL